MANKLRIGIPTRFLLNPTLKLFKGAGYDLLVDEQAFRVEIDDPEIECFLGRTREIAQRVQDGVLDAGISGNDGILEAGACVVEVCDLDYTREEILGKGRIVLVVPELSDVKEIKDLEGKTIITRFPKMTADFLRQNGVSAKIEISDVPNEHQIGKLADAGAEFTLTGSSLEAHGLRVISEIKKISAVFIANEKALQDDFKKEKIENLALLLKGARQGQEMVGLMMHAANSMMEEVLRVLPSLKKPTVTLLRGENWFEVFTVAKSAEIRHIIPKLKQIGCTDIIEFPLNKVIR